MALNEPLLHSVGVEAPTAGKEEHSNTARKEQSCSEFEQLIQSREAEGIWQFYSHENRNSKDIQVIDLLIQRLTYHAEKMSEQNAEHKVLQRLRDVGVELTEFQSRLHNLPLLRMFTADLEAIKGFSPLPTKQNLKNFFRAIGDALDAGIKIAQMNELDDPEEQDPDEEDGESEDGSAEESGSVEGTEESGSAEGTEEGNARAEDLLAKYSAKQLRQELKQLGLPAQRIAQQKTSQDLANLLAQTLNSNDIKTVEEFADKWWAWKGTLMLRESEVEPVRELCPRVGRCFCKRLEAALPQFDKFPACEWFQNMLKNSMEENHFGLLSFNFEIDDDVYVEALPEGMPWTQLGVRADAMQKLRLIDETALLTADRAFAAAITYIHSRTLPAFILKLTRMKAVMASQVAMADQARNKVLAGVVTASMALLSFMMHAAAKNVGDQ
mmetsp:Transcript_58484/g.187868  ORF Transcript_58484/g.187868 Transcript_58484/m.187868 type:complete len:440 (+) Transcript_58484:77-1396(+)